MREEFEESLCDLTQNKEEVANTGLERGKCRKELEEKEPEEEEPKCIGLRTKHREEK